MAKKNPLDGFEVAEKVAERIYDSFKEQCIDLKSGSFACMTVLIRYCVTVDLELNFLLSTVERLYNIYKNDLDKWKSKQNA